MSLRKACLLSIALGALGNPAGAQRPEARVTASAGTATDVAGLRSRAATVATALSLTPSPKLVLGLGGSGTRFDAEAWSVMAGGSMSGRSSPGRAAVTLNAGADYTTTSYQMSYVTGAVTSAFEASIGPLTAFAGGRASHATSSLPSPDPLGGIPPGVARGTGHRSVSRNGTQALFGGMLRWNSYHGDAIVLRYAEERGIVAGAAEADRLASLVLSVGRASIAGNAGDRDVEGARSNFGSGSLALALSRSVSLEAAGGRYPANRLTGAAAGRFVNLGVSLRLASAPPSVPRPAGIRPPARGTTRLTISAPNATRVELAGDFTTWRFVPAQRAPNGVWYLDLNIPPGEYRYAFRIDGMEWRVPTGVRAADDEFGGKSAWLTVSTTGTQPSR